VSTSAQQFDPTEAPNLNALWTQLAFAEWSRLGMSLVVVCPGSRSAPLVHAVARLSNIPSVIAHDERAAAFVALGAARATGRAAVVVTTSGTAVANLLPAAIEASKTGTPLLLVTADRPPELHDCGANQCISQSGIFGSFARWSIDVPCAHGAIDPSWILSTADEAWRRAHTPSQSAGPVHLNWMFREPLAPSAETWDRKSVAHLAEWSMSAKPWRELVAVAPMHDELADLLVERLQDATREARRVVVSVGALYSPAMRQLVRDVVCRLGYPVIADIGSGLRHGECSAAVVAHGDLIALSTVSDHLMPDAIVRIGGGLSSRRVGEFLARARRSGAREIVVRDGPERIDFQHAATTEVSIDASQFVPNRAKMAVKALISPVGNGAYQQAWQDADTLVGRILHRRLDNHSAELDEPSTARMVAALCPSDATLLVGNSMPIRDADMHASRVAHAPTIAVNRGASGIDGLIATAVGHAKATGELTVALVGDVSLLHDLGALALVATAHVRLVIVVVNNDGGGIFHFLPLADHPRLLEPWTTAPHGVDFSAAAKMFGLEYVAPKMRDDLRDSFAVALHLAADSQQSTLIEVRTVRSENLNFHRQLQAEIVAALDQSSAATVALIGGGTS